MCTMSHVHLHTICACMCKSKCVRVLTWTCADLQLAWTRSHKDSEQTRTWAVCMHGDRCGIYDKMPVKEIKGRQTTCQDKEHGPTRRNRMKKGLTETG